MAFCLKVRFDRRRRLAWWFTSIKDNKKENGKRGGREGEGKEKGKRSLALLGSWQKEGVEHGSR